MIEINVVSKYCMVRSYPHFSSCDDIGGHIAWIRRQSIEWGRHWNAATTDLTWTQLCSTTDDDLRGPVSDQQAGGTYDIALDTGLIMYVLSMMKQGSVRFHYTSQNGAQFKTYEELYFSLWKSPCNSFAPKFAFDDWTSGRQKYSW